MSFWTLRVAELKAALMGADKAYRAARAIGDEELEALKEENAELRLLLASRLEVLAL